MDGGRIRSMAQFARVLVDQSGSHAFDYSIPERLAAQIEVGSRVRVLVRARPALATVVELLAESDVPGVRPIEEVIGKKPLVSPVLIRLGHWLAEYYSAPLEAAMRTILPQVVRRSEIGHKIRRTARLARELSIEEIATLEKRAPKQAYVLRFLSSLENRDAPAPDKPEHAGAGAGASTGSGSGGGSGDSLPAIAVTDLVRECGATRQTLDQLAARGFIVLEDAAVQRDPHGDESFLPAPNLRLNAEQTAIFARVREVILSPPETRRPILLHGVTGSGKTEIYLQAIQLVLEQGKTAIVLVPEISLTPQTVERFKSRFAHSQREVAVLHSHLSQGERHDEWHKINNGQARIVIGARSAVFAPVGNLGLIVVDEEHEISYKQEEAPRYHARDVSVVRAQMERCAILLGSATPSIESFHNADTGKYELLELRGRIDGRRMPHIRVIDMRLESTKTKGAPAVLSETLCAAIKDRLAKKQQSILFLNRRGFSTFLICTSCGHVCTCPNCSVALTFHRSAFRLNCHICSHVAVVPPRCPGCHDPRIRYHGMGTEKVEEAVGKLFPEAVVRRMDADAMSRKDALRETLGAFRAGKIDILVGTQMIAKGLHFPNVTLVGIINADLGLHLPDFRAGERTFGLLTQVAGRAGRGEVEGEVFVQTFTPFHPAIQFARHHDFHGFWEQEIEFRKNSDFPPFTHMVLVTIRSEHQARASFSAETLARRLREVLPPLTVLSDPAPAPLEKSRGQFRFHLMLRTRAILKLTRALRAVMAKLTFPEDVTVSVDVDPYQLL